MYAKSENLKKVQENAYVVLKEVVALCNKNHVTYFLAEGTLLGAIRHNGFIPWDDDIDICMPREEFERFFYDVSKELPTYMRCELRMDTDIWGTMRISDTRHTMKTIRNNKEIHLNSNIDIFPIDGMPNNAIARNFHLLHAYLDFCLFRSTRIAYIDRTKKRNFFIRLVIEFIARTHVYELINKEKALERLNDILKKYSYKNSKYVFNFFSEYRKRTIFPKAFYLGDRKMLFEDMLMRIPYESEKILESEYGEGYMAPPIEEERKPKHDFEFIS